MFKDLSNDLTLFNKRMAEKKPPSHICDVMVRVEGVSSRYFPSYGLNLNEVVSAGNSLPLKLGAYSELQRIFCDVPLKRNNRYTRGAYNVLKACGLGMLWPGKHVGVNVTPSPKDECVEHIENEARKGNLRIIGSKFRIIDFFSIIVKIVDLPVVDGGDEVDAQAEALAARSITL